MNTLHHLEVLKKLNLRKDNDQSFSQLKLLKKQLKELESNLLLFFVGSRTTSSILTNHISKIKK